MKANNTIQEVRNGAAKLQGATGNGGRIPVIVFTPYNKRKGDFGIQFWTPEMIQTGTSSNTDGSVSTYQENL